MFEKQINWIHLKIGEDNAKYLKDFSNFGFWYFISAFIAMFSTIIVNSSLAPEEMGRYSYNKSILELCDTFLSFTIYKSYLRFNIKGVSVVLKRVVYWITIVGVLLLAGITVFLTKSVIAIPFALLMVYNERFYFTRSVMDVNAVNKIRMYSVSITLAIIGALFLLKITIKGEYILLAYGLGYAYSLKYYRNTYPQNDDRGVLNLKTILKFSLPGFAIFIVNWLINLYGQVVIKEAYGYVDVAKFAIAQRSILVLTLFSGLLLTFYPMMYYRLIDRKDKRSLLFLRVFMSSIMVIVGVFAFIFAELIYKVLGASQYLEYVAFFRILIVSNVIHTVAGFFGNFLGYALKTYISLIISASGALINITLLHLFLSTYGIGFVPVAILIANIVMAIILLCTSFRMERAYLRS